MSAEIFTINGSAGFLATSSQLVLGETQTVILSAPTPAASRTYTLIDSSTDCEILLGAGAQTITGSKTWSSNIIAAANIEITLPLSGTGTSGVITAGGSRFIHNTSPSTDYNLFMGVGAGNFTLSGTSNCVVGSVGSTAAPGVAFTSASNNSIFGCKAGGAINSGSNNALFGVSAGAGITSGNSNICVGPNTGAALTTQSRCIDISDGTLIAAAANRTILGTSATTSCYVSGIKNVGSDEQPFKVVMVDTDTDQLFSDGSNAIIGFSGPVVATDNRALKWTGDNTLAAEIADATHPGCVTEFAQTIGGLKTFAVGVDLVTTTLTTGYISQGGVKLLQTPGTNNLFLGLGAGVDSVAGSGNVFIGTNAGTIHSAGSNSVYIGYNAGANNNSLGNCIAIGTNAASTIINEINFIEISDGTFGTTLSGDVRIGMSTSIRCYIGGINAAISGTPSLVVLDPANNQLGVESLSKVTSNFTVTLDIGSITTMTVRGVSTTTMPLTFAKIYKTVTLSIPNFSLTAQTGSAITFNLTGAGAIDAAYRPTFACSFIVFFLNNTVQQSGVLLVSASGFVTLTLLTSAAFVLPTGPLYDLAVSWIVD